MAVPAHDTRDFEFAQTFNLPIICIIRPDAAEAAAAGVDVEAVLAGKCCWTGNGEMMGSANCDGLNLNGLPVEKSKALATEYLAARGLGRKSVKYKLRDWLFSRQRYWGEPFPVVRYEDGSVEVIDESELPVTLPEMSDFKPSGNGEPPLAKAENWVNYVDPKTGRRGRRETNTMPQWAGSCWYYLRYIDPQNDEKAWDPAKERYWMPVDLYVGGAEHAVLHLLYARFWHKVLFDLGYVTTKEPFKKLINQGMILGVSYKDQRGVLQVMDNVDLSGEFPVSKITGERLVEFPAKMSKSLKNVINPDDVIRDYGADSMRLYEMFMGPLEATKPWNTKGVEGVFRFLRRSYRMVVDTPVVEMELTPEQNKLMHATISKVTSDLDNFSFNTAISQLMIFVNEFSKCERMPRVAAENFVKLLSVFAPHLGEELWQYLGHNESIAYEKWPEFDPAALIENEVEILVQLCGKAKAKIMMPADADNELMEKLALADEAVQNALGGRPVRKVICVKGRLVNIVG